MTNHDYDVTIIGAGASGSALLYTLAQYSTIKKIALIEKYDKAGQVNSKSSNNSQTLHVGDIETNYSLEKVKQVYPAAMMIAEYAQKIPKQKRDFIFPTAKMVLGVGDSEVASLEKRFTELSPLFPDLKKLNREQIQEKEPMIVRSRKTSEPIVALATDSGFAVDFEKLAQQFVHHAVTVRPDITTHFSQEVIHLEKNNSGYTITTKQGKTFTTKILIVNADSYSLLLAQKLGYGKEFSLIPIAGSFYFSGNLLNGKVYMVQDPKLPFAAVHGDPDITNPEKGTRWGPTARFYPVLEARNFKTMFDFIRSSGFEKLDTWKSFAKILFDKTRFFYLLENMLYELPFIGKRMFIKNVRKIIPSITARDVKIAKGYGGMRLQRVDTTTKELLLGEGKIIGDQAIFNMTPSPGASVALYNAMRDAETIAGFLGDNSLFNKSLMVTELYKTQNVCTDDVSQKDTYVS